MALRLITRLHLFDVLVTKRTAPCHRLLSGHTTKEPATLDTIDLPQACTIPLSQELPGLKQSPSGSVVITPRYQANLTKLRSGMRVASEPTCGEFCTIGVIIDAGSRYEVAYPSGVCHFIEKLAYNSTVNHNTRDDVTRDLERYSGICDCQQTKDSVIYAASCHVSGVEHVLKLIADTVLRPTISKEEFSLAKEVVRSNIQAINMKPEPEELLTDLIHMAAYRDNTLGLPKICPSENLDKIDVSMLYAYMKTYFIPARMVATSIGVDHDRFVQAAKQCFEDTPPIWEQNPVLLPSHIPPVDESVSQYTGGIVKIEKDLSNVGLAINPFPELVHFALGFESCGYKDEDFVPFCVLNSLMGGGGSFSAGGPGKGMYTRLYLNVLNLHHWLYSATSYNMIYSDSGLFYIYTSTEPNKLDDAVSVVLNEYFRMEGEIGKEELSRAKIQLQSMLLMNLEQRPVMFEDVARQVLGHGYRKSPLEYVEEIRKVSAKDIHRIAERLLSTSPAVVGYGTLKKLPDYEKIQKSIVKRDVSHLRSQKYHAFG